MLQRTAATQPWEQALAEVCVLCLSLNLAVLGKPTQKKHLDIFQTQNDAGRSGAVIKHACLLKYVYNRYGIL